MAAHTPHSGVQNADIESAINRLWVREDEIVGNLALPEAMAMKRYAKLLDCKCLRLSGGEHFHDVWKSKTLRDLAFCIVVAVEHKCRNICFRETTHLAGEK